MYRAFKLNASMQFMCFVLAFGAAMLLPPYVQAQQIGDAAVGHALAEEWCGSCHMTGPDSRSGTDLAAPFSEVARNPQTNEQWLRSFLTTPHDRMPNLSLSREETDNLIAYILSLRQP